MNRLLTSYGHESYGKVGVGADRLVPSFVIC